MINIKSRLLLYIIGALLLIFVAIESIDLYAYSKTYQFVVFPSLSARVVDLIRQYNVLQQTRTPSVNGNISTIEFEDGSFNYFLFAQVTKVPDTLVYPYPITVKNALGKEFVIVLNSETNINDPIEQIGPNRFKFPIVAYLGEHPIEPGIYATFFWSSILSPQEVNPESWTTGPLAQQPVTTLSIAKSPWN